MAIVWAFPGQGSQRKGMADGLFERFPDLTAQADEVLGLSVRELAGDLRRLDDTRHLQPVMFTVNALRYLDLAAAAPQPDFMVGHSLGEYSALFAAGAVDFTTGLRLTARRAELMGGIRGGGMLAVLGLDEDRLRQVLVAADAPDVEVANYNSSREIVVCGPRAQVRAIAPLVRAAGAAKTKLLQVSVAAHSRHMAPAAARLRQALDRVVFAEPRVPVLSNATVEPHTADRVPELLERQLCAPVQWRRTMRYLLDRGVEELVEVGPGTVLTKLWAQAREEWASVAVAEPVAVGRPTGSREPADPGETADVREPDEVVVPAAVATWVGPAPAERLGAAGFRERYGLRLAYAVGASGVGANGSRLVSAAAGAGALGFADAPVSWLATTWRADGPPAADVRVVEVDLPLGPTPELVRFRFTGAHRDRHGRARPARHVVARVMGLDCARAFLNPPGPAVLEALVRAGALTSAEADAARHLPVASDLAVASPAGWHGGGLTMLHLLPEVRALARGVPQPVHVGVSGGVGTPEQAAAAFALGADFLLTTSVNLCAEESALTAATRAHLAALAPGDTGWTPDPSHFTLGARSEVLRRGTLFAARANHLVDLYRRRAEPDAATLRHVEETYVGHPLDQIAEGVADPRRRLAEALRWYLRRAAAWRDGAPEQPLDYRLPCGPDLAAFNRDPGRRAVAGIADHLMAGAADLVGAAQY
ncbi:ACP S-malonyltransferase [Frankia sp. CcWB3]